MICGSPDGRAWGSYSRPRHAGGATTPRSPMCGATWRQHRPACTSCTTSSADRCTPASPRIWRAGGKSTVRINATGGTRSSSGRLEWFPNRPAAWRAGHEAVRTALPFHNGESWTHFTGGQGPELPPGIPPNPELPNEGGHSTRTTRSPLPEPTSDAYAAPVTTLASHPCAADRPDPGMVGTHAPSGGAPPSPRGCGAPPTPHAASVDKT